MGWLDNEQLFQVSRLMVGQLPSQMSFHLILSSRDPPFSRVSQWNPFCGGPADERETKRACTLHVGSCRQAKWRTGLSSTASRWWAPAADCRLLVQECETRLWIGVYPSRSQIRSTTTIIYAAAFASVKGNITRRITKLNWNWSSCMDPSIS